jgi:putative sterol carrier protein
MTPKEIFENQIATRLQNPAQQAKAKEIDAVYQFNVNGDDGGQWVVDLKECKVSAGTAAAADCTITVGSADFVNLVQGKVPGPQLFMMGKLQVSGNMGLAMKLGSVLGG